MGQARRFRISFTSIQSRIAVALGAWLCMLAVVGGYGVSVTLSAGYELRAVHTFHDQLYTPTEQLVATLQQERRLSLEYLGSGRSAGRNELERQARQTDQAAATFRRLAGGADVQDAAGEPLKDRITALGRQLDELGTVRQTVADGSLDRSAAAAAYTARIDTAFDIHRAIPIPSDEPTLVSHHDALVALERGRELLSQEIAAVSGALATRHPTARDRAAAQELAAAKRALLHEAESLLEDDHLTAYRKIATGGATTQLRALEDDLARWDGRDELPVSITTWTAAGNEVLTALQTLDAALADDLLSLSQAAADDVFVYTGVVVAVGLAVVVLFAFVWLQVAPRHVAKQLTGLREAALTVAHERLPRVVDQLSHGERVDVRTVAPPLEFGPDEFGEVGRAFNAVQQTAVETAIHQAELRDGIREVFVALARRSQGLIRRQLGIIDAMERTATDPDVLRQLFEVDHLATRQQRQAEALIILSGATPGRRWRHPVPLVDVVRGAIGEVESYARVTILPIPEVAVASQAVADVIHLLAELTENATAFSPPQTKVSVGAELVAAGLVVEVEDAGLGMSDEDLELYNQRLAHAPEWALFDARRLGLFVVARLAARHDITVHLRRSPYGGTTAIVLIPEGLTTSVAADGPPEAIAAAPEPAPAPEAVPQPRAVPAPSPSPTPRPSPTTPRAAGRTADPAPPATEEEALPTRVRQASLAAPLRQDPTASGQDPAAPRPPEQVRAMMSAFQQGTVQGRADARKPHDAQ